MMFTNTGLVLRPPVCAGGVLWQAFQGRVAGPRA